MKMVKHIDKYTQSVYNYKCKEAGMKRKDLVKLLEKNGWTFIRHGGDHDVYMKNKTIEMVPRHREIEERLAKAIIKRQGLK